MFQYWGFGLHISSEIEFPEFLPADFDVPDVEIRLGTAPSHLDGEDVVSWPKLHISPSEYLLTVDNVGRYHVTGGKTITIEPAHNSDIRSVRLFFLGNAMAAILHQKQQIPLHASGIITENGLVLFTGISGAGKSTLTYGLMQRGYPIFTDDVCVLQEQPGKKKITAVASYPMMKLWESSVDLMQAHEARNYQLRPEVKKYGLFQHHSFCKEQLPVRKIFALEPSNEVTGFHCTQLKDMEAFAVLQKNTYRRSYVDAMNLQAHHFKMIVDLAKQASVFKLVRPQASLDVHGFIDFVENEIKKETT